VPTFSMTGDSVRTDVAATVCSSSHCVSLLQVPTVGVGVAAAAVPFFVICISSSLLLASFSPFKLSLASVAWTAAVAVAMAVTGLDREDEPLDPRR